MIRNLSLLFAGLLLFAAANSYAQTRQITKTYTRTTVTRRPLDTNRVVYDQNGQPLRYHQYQKLLLTGDYTLRYDGSPSDTSARAYLKKLTPEEHTEMFKRMKSFYLNKSPFLQENKELDITPLLGYAAIKQELDNKVIVLIFWSTQCPPCTESFSILDDYFKEINDPDKIIIMALTRDKDLAVASKMQSKPLKNARLINDAGKIIDAYQNRQLPAFVVANKKHIITYSLISRVAEFKDAIKAALAE